ncbi:Alpha-ribazole-5'-phosphate phosphatase [Marinobacterium lacunae]|uniref:Alpha-ribazole-5'-phosphate phosphatase n=1 Tax=Marinobacterium lacunae TaxID=1232683 RepID=A0A081G2W8_9GAMM|nr:histidine phosphatase family protein [Marinobacterium lacunae]KEA65123.1 Alpha-ribazole-5'-phosphate phosphatase [Marinobacterium lacunae]
MSLTLELLRHGETIRGRCYLGRTDAPLNERGWQQMHEGLSQRSADQYDAIISSPRSRCLDFARAWADDDRLSIEPRIAEYDFGEWDGMTGEELYERYPQALSRFWSDPWRYPPPGAESMPAFFTRLESCLDDLKRMYTGRVLLICHGGVICVMRSLIERLPREQLFECMPKHGSLHLFEDIDQ